MSLNVCTICIGCFRIAIAAHCSDGDFSHGSSSLVTILCMECRWCARVKSMKELALATSPRADVARAVCASMLLETASKKEVT